MYPLPLRDAIAVTPSDSAENRFVSLYVNDTGDVAVEPSSGGPTVTFTVTVAGAYLWIGTLKVLSTGTTATDIVGLR